MATFRVKCTDSEFGFSIGYQNLIVHDPDQCEGRRCSIHNPSDHHMRHWEQLWRGDKGMMERTCPCHGTGHPDPDDLWHKFKSGKDVRNYSIHACQGCCVKNANNDRKSQNGN